MEFIDYVNRIGIPWAAVICMLTIGWKGGKAILVFLARKFFSDDRDDRGKRMGYIPKLVDEHIDVMETVRKSVQKTSDMIEELHRDNKEIKNKINCPPHMSG